MAIKALFYRGYNPTIGYSNYQRPVFDGASDRPLFIDVKMVSAVLSGMSLYCETDGAVDVFGDVVWPAGSHTHTANFTLSRSSYYAFAASSVAEKTTAIGYSETYDTTCYIKSQINVLDLKKPTASYFNGRYFILVIRTYTQLLIGATPLPAAAGSGAGGRLYSTSDFFTPWTAFTTGGGLSSGGSSGIKETILTPSIVVSRGS